MHREAGWIHHLSSAHQQSVEVIRMVSLTSARVKAPGRLSALTLLWPGFHCSPEAASPTVMGEDKQVDIAAIVVPGAIPDLREGGGRGGKKEVWKGKGSAEKDTPEPELTDRNR